MAITPRRGSIWRVALDPDGDIGEITFGRAGARISEQSEGAAAVVVSL